MTKEYKKDYKVGDKVRVVDVDTMVKRGGQYDRKNEYVDFYNNTFVSDMYPHIGSEFEIDYIDQRGMICKWNWDFSPEMLELVEEKQGAIEDQVTKHINKIELSKNTVSELYEWGIDVVNKLRTLKEKGVEVDWNGEDLCIDVDELNVTLHLY